MRTTCPPSRPVVILLDTHRVWLADTEASNEIPPDASRTFGPPKLCPVSTATWAVVLVTAIATACAVVHVVARIVA